jgi:hypothetical protein
MTVPLGLAATAGLVVWLAVGFVSGRREAWDSSLYFLAGIPVMCVIAFALAYRFPERAWLLALGIAFGQSIGLLFSGGSLSLWPLTIVAMTVLSLPQLAAAIIASAMAKRRVARTD